MSVKVRICFNSGDYITIGNGLTKWSVIKQRAFNLEHQLAVTAELNFMGLKKFKNIDTRYNMIASDILEDEKEW